MRRSDGTGPGMLALAQFEEPFPQRLNRVLKDSAFSAQPLKGQLNSKNLRHR